MTGASCGGSLRRLAGSELLERDMAVKARWHGAASESPVSVDPFEDSYSGAVATIMSAPPIDLSTPEPVLRDRLTELLRREGNLYACGTECPLKDMPDGSCVACPVSRANAEVTDDMTVEDARMRLLCRIGREQETTAMVLLAKRHHVG